MTADSWPVPTLPFGNSLYRYIVGAAFNAGWPQRVFFYAPGTYQVYGTNVRTYELGQPKDGHFPESCTST